MCSSDLPLCTCATLPWGHSKFTSPPHSHLRLLLPLQTPHCPCVPFLRQPDGSLLSPCRSWSQGLSKPRFQDSPSLSKLERESWRVNTPSSGRWHFALPRPPTLSLSCLNEVTQWLRSRTKVRSEMMLITHIILNLHPSPEAHHLKRTLSVCN